ncbi:MAG: repair protein RecN [Myxococcales bacterium]|nr:repair protein RecN [Myxococcales bacterium]
MLTHLRITDFALLDDVEVEFGPGFNVLTGETGAGKSLLVEAVALLRGGRGSADVVRNGAEEARVEAIFEPPHGPAAQALTDRLARAGIDPVDEGLVVRRVIGKSGRGRVYINNVLATAAALGDVAGVLIELAGQHEHQTLGDPSQHLSILDAFGNHQLGEMAAAHARIEVASKALSSASLDERTRAEREEFLKFQLKELVDAALEPGEDERLKLERERLRSAEKLLSAARRGEDAIYAREGAIAEELGTIGRELAELGKIDPELGRVGKQIDEARVTLEEASRDLRHYADGLDADPERLSEVEERTDLVMKLIRKHRAEASDVAGLIRRRDALHKELGDLTSHEARRAELAVELEAARAQAKKLATALTSVREKAAKTLQSRVGAALAELAMAGARLVPALSPTTAREGDDPALVFDGRRLGATGWDRVEFQLAANKGDEPRPLHRIASGGELSRIMLALKRILSRADQVATYVFDEVDAGIGGAVADVVGRQIRAVAEDKQVLCITHLPQIAAHAAVQFRVEKVERGGRVHTNVRKLTASERKEEIARMLGGKVTPKARAHAEELLKGAREADA